MRARYFRSPTEFRRWLEEEHTRADELLVGYYKKHTLKPSMTWSESVDEAVCFGWIDGIRHKVDEDRYTIRFTPRRSGSVWSKVNLDKVKVLRKAGRMMPAGLAVYEGWNRAMSPAEAAERAGVVLDAEFERRFKRSRTAWTWFQALAPGYRKQSIHWVMSATRAETRERRLATLIESSAEGRKIPALRRAGE